MVLLLWRTLMALPQAGRQRQKVLDQFFEIGNASLLMVCILSFFIGGVIALQTGPLLVERGSVLSHSAIVAREYGLPGVVGCIDATSRIKDGARVRVDGTKGEVEVL